MNRQLMVGVIIGAAAASAIGAVAGYRLYESANFTEVISVTPAVEPSMTGARSRLATM